MPVTKERIEAAAKSLYDTAYYDLTNFTEEEFIEIFSKEFNTLLAEDRAEREINSVVQCDHCGNFIECQGALDQVAYDKIQQAYCDGQKAGMESNPLAKLERLAVEKCEELGYTVDDDEFMVWEIGPYGDLCWEINDEGHKTPQEAIDAAGEREEEEKC